MRIETKGGLDYGFTVTGYVETEQWGETSVISLFVEQTGVKVGMSMSLPVQHGPAKAVLECFNESMAEAEALFSRSTEWGNNSNEHWKKNG